MADPDLPRTPAEAALADRLHALGGALERQVEATPGANGTDTGATASLSLAEPSHRPRRVLVGVAAAIVAIGGLVGGLALASRTDGPSGPDPATGGRAGTGPTGWYLPSALPAGWSIDSVRMIDPSPAPRVRSGDVQPELPCWCESATLLGPDGEAIQATTEAGVTVDDLVARYGEAAADVDEQVDGVTGHLLTLADDPGTGDDATRVLLVGDGKRVLRLVGQVGDLGVVRELAVSWIRNGIDVLVDDLTPLPDGWTLTSMGSTRPGQRVPYVRVTLDTGAGTAAYDLVAPGSRPLLLGAIGRSEAPAGASLALVGGGAAVAAPAADVVAGPVADDGIRAQLDAVVRSVAPVSEAAWRATVEPVPSDEPVHEPSLAAALFHASAGRPSNATTVEVGPFLGSPRYEDVEGLELFLDVVRGEVVEGTPLGAWVLARNTTDRPLTLNECNESTVAAGLLPVADLDGPVPLTQIIDCYAVPRTTIPPGATARFSLYDGLVTVGAVVAEGNDRRSVGPLAPGTYRAAATIHSRRGDLRAVDPRPIEVVPDPCPALDGDLLGHRGQAPTTGKAAAVAAGLTFRSIRITDDPGPTDCDRVTAYVTDDLSTMQILVRG